MNKDCSTCICKEGSCYPSTTIFDKDKTCKSYDPDYEGYIAELEETINKLREQFALRYDLEDKLRKENAELKEQNRNYEQLIDKGSVTLAKERLKNYKQLTKAKDHIKQLLDCLKHDTNDPETNYYVCQYMDKAEQFIKDLGK